MSKKAISYVGWLGHQNIGDEAIYIAIRELFREYELTPYNSYSFLVENRRLPFLRIECPVSLVSVFGGGTLLPDDVTWIKPNKYNYVFGAGVKDPIFRTKFDNFNKTVIDRLKHFNFRFIGVRDKSSKHLLDEWGIASEVIGDPVLSLKANSEIKRDNCRVAINIGCDGFLWGGDQNRVAREMIGVCKILKENGYSLVLIPFSKQDIPYVVTLSEKAGVTVFDKWTNLQSVVNLIATCQVLIGQRLHSLAMSAAAYTPFVCLEYRPKCSAFSETVGFSRYCIRTDKVSAKLTTEKLNDLLSNWTKMQNLLKKRVDDYRKRQIKFVERMREDFDSLPEDAWVNAALKERIKNGVFWNSDVFMRRNFGNIWRVYNRLIFLRLIRYLL